MAPKKAKEPKVSEPAKEADKPKEDESKYRVQCKAGMLTYNECNIITKEDLEAHHKELKEKFKHNLILSSCIERESRLHMHTFFDCTEKMNCDLQFFATKKSGPVGDIQNNRGKNVSQGHYYCQCTWKKSHIMCIFDEKKKSARRLVNESVAEKQA